VFHLITHAFFKALLFLGSGSVIHGVEHGHHHAGHEDHDHESPEGDLRGGEFDANDMMNMGGLLRRMPATGWAFIAGALALTGVFPWAGFWSKDEILADAWKGFTHGTEFGVAKFWPVFVFAMLALAALLTAFYTARLVFLTFAGRPRTEAAHHAPESVPSMTWPLIILAVFSTFLGLFGMPWASQVYNLLGKYGTIMGEHIPHGEFNALVAGISLFVAGLGWFFGWLLYGRKPLVEAVDPMEKPLGLIYTLLKNRYYIDQLYHKVIVRPVIGLASVAYAFDDRVVIDPLVDSVGRFCRWLSEWLKKAVDNPIIDGAVNGVGRVTAWFGEFMRATQTGQIQNYLLVAVATVLFLLIIFLARMRL